MPTIPSVVTKTRDGSRSVDIFTKLLENKVITLFTEINNEIAELVIAELLYLDSRDKDYSEKNPIKIYINSPGGSVTAGLAIHDTMIKCNHQIHVTCLGMAASMGAVLLAAGDKRFCMDNAEVMIHQPLGGAQGQATEIEIAAEHIKATKLRLNTILSENTGKDIDTIAADTERDNWLTAQEALEYGLVDEIISLNKVDGALKPSLARRKANAERFAESNRDKAVSQIEEAAEALNALSETTIDNETLRKIEEIKKSAVTASKTLKAKIDDQKKYDCTEDVTSEVADNTPSDADV